MDDKLRKIGVWASHGTMNQFFTEISSKTAQLGYQAELKENTLTCYRLVKSGGLMGIGGKKVKQPVLTIIHHGNGVTVPPESVDEQFIDQLLTRLKAH
ncbi:MAG: hypothetical protein ACYC5M_09195 [Anaerolineae bacterium]